MTEKETQITDTAAKLGLTMTADFVPWSLSRNAGEKDPSLNWKITLHKDGRPFLTTDYMAGSGHCPSYKQHFGTEPYGYREIIRFECEHGRRGRWDHTQEQARRAIRDEKIEPKFADVLYSLVSDAEAIDHPTFEEWAENLGYDTDSRKAETIYRACLEIALKFRAAIGEDGLQELREVILDY